MLEEQKIKNELQEYINYVNTYRQIKKTSTGFQKLDLLLNGGLPNGLISLGAITSIGKTSFILQLADNIANQENTKVLFFSLEMNSYDLISRSLSRLSFLDKDSQNYTYDDFMYHSDNIPNFDNIISNYEQTFNNIEFRDNLYSMRAIEGNIFEFRNDYPDDKIVVIIDYLQYVICGTNTNDKQAIDFIVKKLKELSKRLDITIIAISSINRANYKNDIDIDSFKESGSIEYISDILIGLELTNSGCDKQQELKRIPRKITLNILKNRYGALGKVNFEFYTPYYTFIEK